ncbi:MAG: hypothetical protein U0838_03865 [Chloroflexota bacterium]
MDGLAGSHAPAIDAAHARSGGVAPAFGRPASPSAAPSRPLAVGERLPGLSPSPVPGGWSYVGEKKCPDGSEFTCVTLAVPRDHYTAGGPTWDMSFAIRHATGKKVAPTW